MTSAELFRANVRRLAATLQIDDLDALASALDCRGEDKRWLRRLWNEGLSRPDPRRAKQLRRLAAFLKQAKVTDLWNPQANVNPFDLMENRQEWAVLVERVIRAFQVLQQAKLRRSEAVREVLIHYGFSDEHFVADWVAWQSGQNRPNFEELDGTAFYAVAEDMRTESQFAKWFLSERKQRLCEYVTERVCDHPNWQSFQDRLRRFCKDKYGAQDSDLSEVMDSELDEMLGHMSMRPLSPQEIKEQFVNFYLEESPHRAVVVEGLPIVLDQLRSHAQWDEWVEVKHDGDEERAESQIGGMWQHAVEQTGHGIIRPEHFVAYMYQRLNTFESTD